MLKILSKPSKQLLCIGVNAVTYPQIVLAKSAVIKAYLAIAGASGGYGTGTILDSLILRAESGSIHLMNSSAPVLTVTGGNVGIGVIPTTTLLDVKQPTLAIGNIFQAWAPGVAGANFRVISTTGQPYMQYDFNNGNVVVAGTLGNLTLGGSGAEVFFSRNSANYITANGGTGAEIRIISNTLGVVLANGGTSWGSLSDENLKVMTEWKTFINPLEKIISLRAGTSRYKTDSEDISRSFLIAQDVQKVLPEAVSVDEDGILGLRYTEVIPLMISAIQELNAKITELENK